MFLKLDIIFALENFNLYFLFSINGVKIFLCGDSNPAGISDYKHFCLDKENIDIAFIGRGLILSTDCERIDITKDYIHSKHIIPMLIHHDQNKHFIDVAEKVKAEFPSVKVFENRMETKNYIVE